MRASGAGGFTLVETLVAAGLLAVGLVALADLGARSLRAGVVAGATTYASLLAGDKVEALRAATLAPSPPGTLDRNVAGYVDHLDRAGRVVGAGVDPPGATAFTRRWDVAALPGAPGVHVVRVEVRPRGAGEGLHTVHVAALVRGGGAAP